jgi:hydrogenase nickel incorporation protein HypB
MCATCGCSAGAEAIITRPGPPAGDHHPEHHHHHHEHDHAHGAEHHDHPHAHDGPGPHHHGEGVPHTHVPTAPRSVLLEQEILAKNDRLAEQNRAWLDGRGVLAVNLMSSPGSGKTTLLERTIERLAGGAPIAVIEGDQETLLDAARIRATGARAVQVNTGRGCHLDAAMVAQALRELDPAPGSLLFIENVGNLVCPALFALGEHANVVIASITEGEDKPLKYPHMFRACQLLVLNKIDLLPHVAFDPRRFVEHARRVHPELSVLQLSATRGDGLDAWFGWLQARLARPGSR